MIRGGDGMAGFAVRHPNGQIVQPYQWIATSAYTDAQSTGGYYAICLDNQFSRFASKTVNIYITVIKYDEWDKYTKEIEALQLNMQNFTVNIWPYLAIVAHRKWPFDKRNDSFAGGDRHSRAKHP